MIRRIWNSLLRGSKKTKTYLWTLLALLLSTVMLVTLAVITGAMYLFILAIMCVLIGFCIFKSVSFSKIMSECPEDKVSNKGQGESTTPEDDSDADRQDDEKVGEDYLNQYSEKSLKTYFHKYKVSKEHFPILIDNSKKYKISQCPAFIWRDKHSVYLFLLEEVPRKITIPIHEVTELFYLKGASANLEADYDKVKNSAFVNVIFQGLYPQYYREVSKGRYVYKKNLYGLANDILITAASAKAIMDYMQLRFEMSSMYISAGSYSQFFGEASKLKVLWKDGVLDAGRYKLKIREILNALALAEYTVSEYMAELDHMVIRQLITEEYAQYYREHRQEIRKSFNK